MTITCENCGTQMDERAAQQFHGHWICLDCEHGNSDEELAENFGIEISFDDFMESHAENTAAEAAEQFGMYEEDFNDAVKVHVFGEGSAFFNELPNGKFHVLIEREEWMVDDFQLAAEILYVEFYMPVILGVITYREENNTLDMLVRSRAALAGLDWESDDWGGLFGIYLSETDVWDYTDAVEAINLALTLHNQPEMQGPPTPPWCDVVLEDDPLDTPQEVCGEILKMADGLEAQGYTKTDIHIMLQKLTDGYGNFARTGEFA